MRLPLPRTLGGQLTVLLLGALVLSHTIVFFVFDAERERSVRYAEREQIISRIQAARQLLSETPSELRGRTADGLSSPRLRFRVGTADGAQTSPMNAREQAIADIFRALAGGDLPGIHVRLGATDGDRRGDEERSDRDDDGDEDTDEDRDRELAHHGGRDRGSGRDSAGGREGGMERAMQRHMPMGFRNRRADMSIRLPIAGSEFLTADTILRSRPRSRRWAWPSLVSLGLTAIAILLIVSISARRITRPLRALADGAERLGRGEQVDPLAASGPLEVRRTTDAFNAMQDRLTRFVRDRTRMLAAISHDLRTPITALRLRAELVEDEDTRTRMLATLEEMQHMTEAALAFARDEAANEASRRTDLAALVQSLCDDMADLGHDVAFQGPEKLVCSVRPMALKRAVRNVVENAVGYGGRARVDLADGPTGPVIRIDDDGPGIPEGRIEAMFDPFVRLDASRSAATGGVGLGLSIARNIIRAHGGDLTLQNRTGGGLRATIALPAGSA